MFKVKPVLFCITTDNINTACVLVYKSKFTLTGRKRFINLETINLNRFFGDSIGPGNYYLMQTRETWLRGTFLFSTTIFITSSIYGCKTWHE